MSACACSSGASGSCSSSTPIASPRSVTGTIMRTPRSVTVTSGCWVRSTRAYTVPSSGMVSADSGPAIREPSRTRVAVPSRTSACPLKSAIRNDTSAAPVRTASWSATAVTASMGAAASTRWSSERRSKRGLTGSVSPETWGRGRTGQRRQEGDCRAGPEGDPAVRPLPEQEGGPSSGCGLRLPEDLVDLGDVVEQLLALGGVHAALAAGGAGLLGRLVEQLVQLRVLLEVRGLEVVGPQHPQVVLDEIRPLFLDQDGAGAEDRVLVALVLLLDGLDALGLDPGLGRVVDAAGEVAVRGGLHGGEHAEQTHGCASGVVGNFSSGTLLAVITDDMPSGQVPPLASRWVLARVTGPSMSPTVRHGDRLLVRRVRRPDDVRIGDVVLARFPARPDLLVVKRVRRAVPGGHWVEGDNPLVADDSRAFGAAVVVGRVVARVWPRPGRLAPPPDAV